MPPTSSGALCSPRCSTTRDHRLTPPGSSSSTLARRPSTANGKRKPRQIVAILRAEAGRSPYDRQLSDLVGELSTRSDLFRKLWGAHDVREHRTGLKTVHHPVVGDLDLTFQAMDLASDRGLQMLVFSAAPGSATDERLQLLANLTETATQEASR
ncbi:hypothetical protein [uncultured Microbacterium sp.]|uniref:MmyB family transcriptional regulator n=1 Tax=uncultured Microbacterium sp. TaxID=191216 RepID=UPI0035C9619C